MAEPLRIPLRDLHPDPKNPRLPDSVQGAPEEEILQYVRAHGELTELARSFADNGYFIQEPILVVDRAEGGYTVVEGNRRVCTLKLLVDDDRHSFIDVDLTEDRRQELSTVPAVVLDSVEDLHRYVGFRHISGLQPWSPEAKARYLFSEVQKVAKTDADAFRVVGRRVGLQPSQVRQAYIAFATLHSAAELGLDVRGVLDHAKRRFGVWLRAVESPGIREFIGVGSPTDFGSVASALKALEEHQKNLLEVITDIGPPNGEPILTDSRYVTVYAKVLANPEALRAKREERDLGTAREIVSRDSLTSRLYKIERSLEAAAREVSALADAPSEELSSAAESVRRAALRLSGAIKAMQAETKE